MRDTLSDLFVTRLLILGRVVLEWVSIYWHARAGPAASARIYYELTRGGESSDLFSGTSWTSVPLGVAHFPGEPISLPKSYVFCAHLHVRALAYIPPTVGGRI